MNVTDIGAALRSGATSARELAETALAAAEENRHGAFVLTAPELALAAADAADGELALGVDRGPLHGVPIALKDVIDVAGLPTAAGLADTGSTATADAAVWRTLRGAGAVLIGKTRLPELAMDVLTPGTVNPRGADRVSGGSSGGSAAAVAAGIVPVALGTDTGGSVRIPAALTGVVGLRPTHGLLSSQGVRPLAPTQDTVGILGTTAIDCLLTFAALTGTDPAPALPAPRLRIGVPLGFGPASVSPAVSEAFERACRTLVSGGSDIVRREIPLLDAASGLSYLLMVAEAFNIWWPRRPMLDPDGAAKRHLAVGSAVSSEEYAATRAMVAEIRTELLQLFDGGIDLIALPTTAATAAPIGTDEVIRATLRQSVGVAYTRFTTLASVTGLPAVSVPFGTDEHGLPIGLQFVAAPHGEALLCHTADLVERLS